MKTPSLNPAALAEFLLRHVEKPVFAALAGLALMLVWWGIDAVRSQAVKPSRTPAAIAVLAEQATDNVARAGKPPVGLLPQHQPLRPTVDPWRSGQATIAPPPTTPAVLSRPLVAELSKRTKPDVFPIEDLQAVAGIAVLPRPGGLDPAARQPDPADGTARPSQEPGAITPYVVVTGLIPTARQEEEFARRFASVSFTDPERDRPRWGVYLVERQRSTDTGPGDWERLPMYKPAAPVGAGNQPPDPDSLSPAFALGPDQAEAVYAAPLPRRIDEQWALSGMHPWFIARIVELQKQAVAEERPADDAPVTLADLQRNAAALVGREFPLAAVMLDANPKRQRDVGYRFIARSVEPRAEVVIGDVGQTTKPVCVVSEKWGQTLEFEGVTKRSFTANLRCRVEMVDRTPVVRILALQILDDAGKPRDTLVDPEPDPVGDDSVPTPAGVPRQDLATGELQLAENRLFRFIDTAVQPGQAYRYRVKFAIRNPNVDLASRHLADERDAKDALLISAFSNETQPVRVPDPVRILARTIDPETKRKLRPKAAALEVMILAPSDQTGNFVLRSVLTDVGGLANVAPALNRPGDVRSFGEPVITDRLLVAAHGVQDERPAGRSPSPPEPLEMLVRRPDGGFDIVAAADDERLIDRYGSTLFRPGTRLPDDGRPDKREREKPTPVR